MSSTVLVDAALVAQPALAAEVDSNERARAIGPATVAILQGLDAFRMFVPHQYGGPEVDPITACAVISAIAQADASAAWCATVTSQTAHMSGAMEPAWAREIFGDPATIACGAFAPTGTAQTVSGGHLVSGRWSWGSASHVAGWLSGGTMTDAGEFHQMLFPRAAVSIDDMWFSTGLMATSSNDFSVSKLFVPDGRSVCFGRAKPTCDAPIARAPIFVLFAAGIAAVMIGIARRSIDEIVQLAQAKRPAQSSKPLAVSPVAQVEIAKADASLRAASRFLEHELRSAWETVVAGDRVSTEQRLAVRLAASHAGQECVRIVDSCASLAGGSAVLSSSPLQRCRRDVQTAAAHIMVSPRSFETVGRHMLGQPIDFSSL